jgi:hypothetical protein
VPLHNVARGSHGTSDAGWIPTLGCCTEERKGQVVGGAVELHLAGHAAVLPLVPRLEVAEVPVFGWSAPWGWPASRPPQPHQIRRPRPGLDLDQQAAYRQQQLVWREGLPQVDDTGRGIAVRVAPVITWRVDMSGRYWCRYPEERATCSRRSAPSRCRPPRRRQPSATIRRGAGS